MGTAGTGKWGFELVPLTFSSWTTLGNQQQSTPRYGDVGKRFWGLAFHTGLVSGWTGINTQIKYQLSPSNPTFSVLISTESAAALDGIETAEAWAQNGIRYIPWQQTGTSVANGALIPGPWLLDVTADSNITNDLSLGFDVILAKEIS